MNEEVTIDYTNHRGERSERKIMPLSIRFGVTEWHPKEQWLLRAFDSDRRLYRDFAMCDIHSWKRNDNG